LGVTRSAITHHITALRKKNYLERIKKGRKSRFTSTLRVIYNEKISAEDAIAIAQLDEDLRSPVMIEREENRMTSRGVRTSRKGKTKEREYQGTSNELESLGEPSVTYNSKLESVLVLYRKIYKEEKVMNELDMKAIELAESIGLTNQEFATGLELWLNARTERPDSIIDYARGL
jgi:DNA-binding transcriptional ArsR family regulator